MLAKTAVLAALLSFPALAAGPVAEINFQMPKPGMAAKYEAARKKHMGWHKKQKDKTPWLTWQVVSGERSGMFVTGSFGHEWKDFDADEKFAKADEADFDKGIGPTLATNFTSYYVERADLMLAPAPADAQPAPMIIVTEFRLKPEAPNDFVEGVKKIAEGMKKTSYPQPGINRWYQLVNGGTGPLYVLVSDRPNWASFAPNEKSLDAMMEEAFGKDAGAATMASMRKSFLSVHSQTLRFRPELSYLPAPAK